MSLGFVSILFEIGFPLLFVCMFCYLAVMYGFQDQSDFDYQQALKASTQNDKDNQLIESLIRQPVE